MPPTLRAMGIAAVLILLAAVVLGLLAAVNGIRIERQDGPPEPPAGV